MNAAPFRLELLSDSHDRSVFDCGEKILDRYFREQVTQDIRRNMANCFVAVETASDGVAGYYTLSAAGVPFTDLPVEDARRLPRYPTVPAVRIGRLAVDRNFQGRGLGAAMLADATARAVQADVAAFMLIVDAKNDGAVTFYQRFGFRLVTGARRTLFLPLATASKIFLTKTM